MAKKQYPYKRRIHFIKKEFQAKFILKFVLLVLMGSLISTGLLVLFSKGTLTASFQHSKLVITDTSSAIFHAIVYTNLVTLGLISLATIIVTLLVSHKIAGPMFRFEKDLEEIAGGNLTKKIYLRKDDQITEMAAALNKMIADLHERVLSIQSEVKTITESASEQDVPKVFVDKLNHLAKSIESKFKI